MKTARHDQFMREAIALSVKNVRSGRGGPFAALVVRNNQIIARGTNLVTSRNDPTAHAEIVAIRRACRRLKSFQLDGCDIYCTCEPCPMCLAAIYWARPARIFFANTAQDAARVGFDDSFIYREVKRPAGQRRLPMKPLLRKEALAAFQEWARKSDKAEY